MAQADGREELSSLVSGTPGLEGSRAGATNMTKGSRGPRDAVKV